MGVWFIGVTFVAAERGSSGVGALAFGFAFLLDAVVGSGTTNLEVGPTAYFVAVAAGVVITERMLRRRDLGPVTLDLVHAPEDEGAARRGS